MRKDDLNVRLFENKLRTISQERFQVKKKISRYRVSFWKKRKPYMQHLIKEWRQPSVVILQQANFGNIFILCLWLRICTRSDQGVQFMIFSSQMFFNDINHGYKAALLKKDSLWLLSFYMSAATYCYYEKVCRTMNAVIASYLLKHIYSFPAAELNNIKSRSCCSRFCIRRG